VATLSLPSTPNKLSHFAHTKASDARVTQLARSAAARRGPSAAVRVSGGTELYLDGVGSELIEEVAVKRVHETEGESNLGHTAVDLLSKRGETTVPEVRKSVKKDLVWRPKRPNKEVKET
jgi:hypothetical protein